MKAAQQAARDAERRFPIRVRIAVPPEGLGSRLDQIIAWLDANCGADGWTSTPSSTRGVVNDALAVYFADATIASAFVTPTVVWAPVGLTIFCGAHEQRLPMIAEREDTIVTSDSFGVRITKTD